MAVVSMKQLLEAGVHFGHQTRRWNPKMAEYIYCERNGIYIIDLQKTVKKLEEAYNFVRELAENGQNILFVGTKKQAAEARKLHIPIIAIVDTNCDPDEVDYVIPANDDAIRAIKLISATMANAVQEGHQGADSAEAEAEKAEETGDAE